MAQNHNKFDSTQFIMSYELLRLLQWLIDHDPKGLQQLVSHALQNGLGEHIKHMPSKEDQKRASAELQDSIIDFFATLEMLLHTSLNEDDTKETMTEHMLPALKYMDTSLRNTEVINTSLEKASHGNQKLCVGQRTSL